MKQDKERNYRKLSHHIQWTDFIDVSNTNNIESYCIYFSKMGMRHKITFGRSSNDYGDWVWACINKTEIELSYKDGESLWKQIYDKIGYDPKNKEEYDRKQLELF